MAKNESSVQGTELVSSRFSSLSLVLNEPHEPAGRDRSEDKQSEAECSEAEHHAWFRALGNSEDDRSEEGKEEHGSEVGDRHEGFLPFASE